MSSAYYDEVKIITSSNRGCLDKIFDLKHDPFEDVNLIDPAVRRDCSIRFGASTPEQLLGSVNKQVYHRHCEHVTKNIDECMETLHRQLVQKIQMMYPKLVDFVIHGNEGHKAFKTNAICSVPVASEVAPITYPFPNNV